MEPTCVTTPSHLFVLTTLLHLCFTFPPDVFDPRYQLVIPGDINIGAILSIHANGHERDARKERPKGERRVGVGDTALLKRDAVVSDRRRNRSIKADQEDIDTNNGASQEKRKEKEVRDVNNDEDIAHARSQGSSPGKAENRMRNEKRGAQSRFSIKGDNSGTKASLLNEDTGNVASHDVTHPPAKGHNSNGLKPEVTRRETGSSENDGGENVKHGNSVVDVTSEVPGKADEGLEDRPRRSRAVNVKGKDGSPPLKSNPEDSDDSSEVGGDVGGGGVITEASLTAFTSSGFRFQSDFEELLDKKNEINLFHRAEDYRDSDDGLHDNHGDDDGGDGDNGVDDDNKGDDTHTDISQDGVKQQPEKLMYCGELLANFQAVENAVAILFALDEINRNDDLLPNITLGVTILDDCFSEPLALARALQFMPGAHERFPKESPSKRARRSAYDHEELLRSTKLPEDQRLDRKAKNVEHGGEVRSDTMTSQNQGRAGVKCAHKTRAKKPTEDDQTSRQNYRKQMDKPSSNGHFVSSDIDRKGKMADDPARGADIKRKKKMASGLLKMPHRQRSKLLIRRKRHGKSSLRIPQSRRSSSQINDGLKQYPSSSSSSSSSSLPSLRHTRKRDDDDEENNSSLCATDLPSHDESYSARSKRERLPPFYDVTGVLGAYTSPLSVVVADVMTLFNLPQISHASTTDILSDKAKYPVFFRTLPADRFQAQAIADLLHYFNWYYVSIVFSADAYGTQAEKILKSLLKERDICVANSIELKDNMADRDYDDVITHLRTSKNARVVALYADIKHIQPLMLAVKRQKAYHEFIWAGSDTTSLVSSMDEENCRHNLGSFSVTMYSESSPNFTEFLQSFLLKHKTLLDRISPKEYDGFDALLERIPNYSKEQRRNVKGSSANSRSSYTPTFTVAYAIDAVYAYAHAIQNFINRVCPGATREKATECLKGKSILPFLKTVSFDGSSGKVCFNEQGDVVGKIAINQCQVSDGVAKQVRVAIWDMYTQRLKFQSDRQLQWPNNSNRIPTSLCAEKCGKGEIYTFPKQTCCWKCVRCQPNEVTDANGTQCNACKNLYWPDKVFSQRCEPITAVFINLGDIVPLVLAIITTLGLMTSVITAFTFYTYRQERIIRSSSRELSTIMIIGLILAFLLQYSHLSPPTTLTCYCNQAGFPLTFTLVYSPLLVKTNRIYRIFTAGRKSAALPKWTSSASQLLFAFCIILVQVIIVTLTTTLAPPYVAHMMPKRMEKYVIRYCDVPVAGFLPALALNLVLVLVCTWYAFKTRRLPDNYNESRYIAFCVDTTVLVWISFVPTYFAITRPYFKAVVLAVALLINSIVCLLCLFVPKMYGLYVFKQAGAGDNNHLRHHHHLHNSQFGGNLGSGCMSNGGGELHIQMVSNLSMTGLIRSAPSMVESTTSSKERTASSHYDPERSSGIGESRPPVKLGLGRDKPASEHAHHGQDIHLLSSTDILVNRTSDVEASQSSSEQSVIMS